MTKKNKAHIGISLDGDADRIIVCDEKGKIIDGDKILAKNTTFQLKDRLQLRLEEE